MSTIHTVMLECGMPLIVEPIDGVKSAAVNWALPIGAATDPPEGDGYAAMLSELIFRGAGDLDSRQHSDALDRLGVRRSASVGTHHLRVTASMVGDRLDEALPLLTDMVRATALPDASLDPVRSLCLQSLAALDDEPQHLVMLRLRERHLPAPFNRTGYGAQSVLERATIDALRRSWEARCVPGGSMLAVAGAVDPDHLAMRLNELLAGWTGGADEPVETAPAQRGMLHVPHESAQTHLGIAWDAPAEPDEHSLVERVAMNVLSGSTSGRLFTEVRQKRSLCYSVGATYRASRDAGRVSLYAGTTPQRAQETLDVCLSEIHRLRDGVREDEFNRAVIGLKSRIVMQGESTPARAGALAYDHFRLGRARTLEEVTGAIDRITLDMVNEYLSMREMGPFTVASIGPQPLAASSA